MLSWNWDFVLNLEQINSLVHFERKDERGITNKNDLYSIHVSLVGPVDDRRRNMLFRFLRIHSFDNKQRLRLLYYAKLKFALAFQVERNRCLIRI